MRAKFKCNRVEKLEYKAEIAHLITVTDGSKENTSFAKFTPVGTLQLTITNSDCIDFFKPGKEYFLDINEVTE